MSVAQSGIGRGVPRRPPFACFLTAQPTPVLTLFWPGSGIPVGILTISCRQAYPAMVLGAVAANSLSNRSLLAAAFKGINGA
jgi:integral membrane sensor domain MASE1